MGVFCEQRSKQILASPERITPPPPRPGGMSQNGKIRNGRFLILPFRTTPPGAVKQPLIWARPSRFAGGQLCRDLGGHYFVRRDPERRAKRLVRQLEALGHAVVLRELAA